MATETYRWFRPDINLRSGTAIVNAGDSAEVGAFALMTRAICQSLGLPAGGTRFLFDYGTATDTFVYARVPELLWPAVSGQLTAAETATVVTTAPAGWSSGTFPFMLMPNPRKKSIILRGDSISAGLGTTTGDTRSIFLTQAINGIAGEALNIPAGVGAGYREGESKSYYIGNMSLGSSSWANTVGQPDAGDANGAAIYPRREDLAFEQRTATLALNGLGSRVLFIYWLGTNDLAYDASLSGADAWARVVSRIASFRSKFPAIKLALCTTMKRLEVSALNNRINDFNVLMRANYAAIGVDGLIDFEANVPQVNIVTGDTTNTTYYTDGIHITNITHGLLGDVARPVLQSLLA